MVSLICLWQNFYPWYSFLYALPFGILYVFMDQSQHAHKTFRYKLVPCHGFCLPFSFFSPSLLVVLFKMFPFDIVSACYCGPFSLSLLVVLNQCLCNIYVDVFVLISVTFSPIMIYTRFWLSIWIAISLKMIWVLVYKLLLA